MNRLPVGFLMALLVFAGSINGQPPTTSSVTPEMRTAANDAFQKKDWATAAANYERIVTADPKNAGALYRLGVALLNLDRAKEAATRLEAAMSISPNAVFGLALARAHA